MSHRFSRRWPPISSVEPINNSAHNRLRPNVRHNDRKSTLKNKKSTFAVPKSFSFTPESALSFGCLHIRQFPVWAARYRNPLFQAQPLLIHRRGKIVAACSTSTKRGVCIGWTLTRARSLCPEALAIAHNAAQIDDVWEEVLCFLYELTPRLEFSEPGSAYFEPPARTSSSWLSTLAALQKLLREWNALVGSVQAAIATDRALAELAAHVVKPGTLQTIRPRYIDTFLRDVPTQALLRLGLSEYTRERLQWFGLRTVKDLSILSREQIACQFYHAASPHDTEVLWRFACAGSDKADRTPIQTYQLPAVRKARIAFEQAATSPAEWEPALQEIIQQATSELNGLGVGAIRLSLETSAEIIRCNKLLRESTSSPRTLFETARELLLLHFDMQHEKISCDELQVQAIEIALARLSGNDSQSTLFDSRRFEAGKQNSQVKRGSRVRQAVDAKSYPSRLIAAVRNIESRYPQSMFRFKQRDSFATLPEDRDCVVPAISAQ